MSELAAIYARVSTDEQAKRGFSLSEQIAVCQKYADERGYRIVSTAFTDDYTGMTMDRPGLDALREAVKCHGIEVVIVTELDRWARKAIYQALLEDEFATLGARVEFVYERFEDSDEGRLFKGIKRELAEYERAKIMRRMSNGRIGKVKSGSIISPYAPYGYNLITTADAAGKTTTRLEINEDEAHTIRQIFQWYIVGDEQNGPLPMLQIAERLTQMKVPTRGDTTIMNRRKHAACFWHDAVVRAILLNETYTGIWYYRKMRPVKQKSNSDKTTITPRDRSEWIQVSVPAIIDQETFEEACKRMAHNVKFSTRNGKNQYLLTSRLRCGCGYALCGATPRKKRFYRCSSKLKRSPIKCTVPTIPADVIEQRVWEWISELMQEDEDRLRAVLNERRAAQEQDLVPIRERIALIDQRLADVQRRITNLRDRLETEADADERADIRTRLTERLKTKTDLDRERSEKLAQLEQREFTTEQIDNLLAIRRIIADKIANATAVQKREVLDLLRFAGELKIEDNRVVCHATCELGAAPVAIGFMYGKTYMGIIRSHFVIDEEGKIADAQVKVSPSDSVDRALAALG